MSFNEDSRVKIPGILHLTRLGYKYLSLREVDWDKERKLAHILNLCQKNDLASLRDWLLPMVMNGQVKVGEAEAKVKEYVPEGEP